MMTFDEYGDELAIFDALNPRPYPRTRYFAYKAGTAVAFETLAEAQAFSPLTEKVVDIDEIKEWEAKSNELFNKKFYAWKTALRAEFVDLSDRQFDRLYEKVDVTTDSHDETVEVMRQWFRVFYG